LTSLQKPVNCVISTKSRLLQYCSSQYTKTQSHYFIPLSLISHGVESILWTCHWSSILRYLFLSLRGQLPLAYLFVNYQNDKSLPYPCQLAYRQCLWQHQTNLRCSGLHWKILVSNFPYNLICHILFNTCVDASRIFS